MFGTRIRKEDGKRILVYKPLSHPKENTLAMAGFKNSKVCRERLNTLAACHGCGGKFRTLFHVKPEDGPAATKVAEGVVSAILERTDL